MPEHQLVLFSVIRQLSLTMNRFVFIGLGLLVAFLSSAFAFSEDRVHFIDKAVSPSGVPNFLFRGNEPSLSNGTASQSRRLMFDMSQKRLLMTIWSQPCERNA